MFKKKQLMHKCAIIYHYLASYRESVFIELMKSEKVEFTLFSGNESEICIKKIDPLVATLPIEDGGLRWEFLKNKYFFKKKFLWQSGLIGIAIKSSYDSIIFLGSPYYISTWVGAIIARLRGKKVFYWMHGVYKDKITFIDYIKMFVFYKIAHGFFLYGKRAYMVLNRYKIKSVDDIHIIYNSLDYRKSIKFRKIITESDIYEYREKYFNDKLTPVVVFIGRLNHVKRLDMLIEAQRAISVKFKKNVFNILIIGDGEEKLHLESLVVKNGFRNNVVFLGAIYDEEINSNALMYADLCVTPGEVGLTAIHSLSYGTPVISHNNFEIQMPEVEAIVEGVTGNFYKYGELGNLAEVIEKWFFDRPIKTQSLVYDCYKIIDNYYNPIFQLKLLESVLVNK
jgi:glycosyltransferase involved in cell wall biosynthesis